MTLMVWCLSTLEFCLCICSDKLVKSEKHKVSMGQHLKVSIVNRPRFDIKFSTRPTGQWDAGFSHERSRPGLNVKEAIK